MNSLNLFAITFLACFFTSLISVPLVMKLARLVGAIDKPNWRNIHKGAIPRLGGLSIIIGTAVGFIILKPDITNPIGILIAFLIIISIGILDDIFRLSALTKASAQIIAALLVTFAGVRITYILLPFGWEYTGALGFILTIVWIVGITNSINLIDGLDGLAGGVSCISIAAIMVMAIIQGDMLLVTWSFILIGSTLGFLIFNLHPAKIFLGDTGSLYLGFSIAIISTIGFFKSITLFSLIIPLLILGVPIIDTTSAIIRRISKKQKLTSPDKEHLHHKFLALGFSHITTVRIIYLVSLLFSVVAISFSRTTLWISLLLTVFLFVCIAVGSELIGLFGRKRRPILNTVTKIYTYLKK